VFLLALATATMLARGSALGEELDHEQLKAAIERGLSLVQDAARRYPTHRECFSCHHQTMPILAMTTARDAGFAVDDDLMDEQVEFSRKFFRARMERLNEGRDIGGRALTIGYGLWTFDLVQSPPDEITSAMVTNLVKTQADDGHWRIASTRPPMGDSRITSTVMAARFAGRYATDSLRAQTDAALGRAKDWLKSPEIASQEDLNSWLSGLALLGFERDAIQAAKGRVLSAQHASGGWPQEVGMEPDAYATGQTLFVLHHMRIPEDEVAIRRGIQFLLDTQGEDGSWFVETRSKPVQVYFDNGDPHGKSQFISTPATAWAVTALAQVYGEDESANLAEEHGE
jgi:N-acyl-D-amino-acid deacylase